MTQKGSKRRKRRKRQRKRAREKGRERSNGRERERDTDREGEEGKTLSPNLGGGGESNKKFYLLCFRQWIKVVV